MPWERPRICPNLLLLEGAEDLKTIPYIMEANGVTWPEKPPKAPVWIEQYEGYSNLLKPETLELELKTNGLEILGMIIDADEDAGNRWQQTRQSCRVSIPDLPEDLPKSGLIHTTEDGIKFGIWIMPDNTSRGMLETFLSLMIPAGCEPLWEHAKESAQAAQQRGATFSLTHMDKANIYTWLAWQKPPGQPFPYALKDRIFNPSHPNAQMFITWFKTLYGL
jgi:hypothetical protein